MSDKKPFWEGKTCKEMANLHVKVTYNTGAVLTGVTNEDGDVVIANSGRVAPLSLSYSNERFVPTSYIKSIELVNDPKYERIDNIEDVREGDVYVGTDGNRYTVLRRTTSNLNPLTVTVINTTFYPHRSYFGYALRPTPKLPDHDGLWLDRGGNTWTMRDGSMQLTCRGADDWCFTRPWFLPDSVQVLNAAPFRPAKVVEANEKKEKNNEQ
ncbi:hypothetical protein MCC01989_08310 [Bifidobacteriaceae bacterium MCC01989]|nr:hypothetical protein MCC01989_08310 [Bifidobacteriaceae bacterium MCC01989]